MSQKFKNPVEVDGQVSAEYLDLSTTTSHSVNAGEIAWNSIDGTFDIGLLNGVTLQAGQEMHFYGKATEAISNGNAVMFAGVQGDHILIAKADAVTINANPEYFMGVATQDFAINDFGYVTAFGNVRNIDTSAYTLGDILYYDSTTGIDGLLTPTMPSAPKAKIIVAAVVKVHATQGILAVRPHTMPRLKDIQDINVDTATTGEILQLQSDGVWENKTLSEAGIVSGSGATNYVAKFTGSTSLGNSLIYDNGTNVGVGTTSPSYKLDVNGDALINGVRTGIGNGSQSSNLCFGNGALNSNTSGIWNVSLGYNTLQSNTTGEYNIAVGALSLSANTTGNLNVSIGESSMLSSISSVENVSIGNSALRTITSGNNNVAIGRSAGRYTSNKSTSVTNSSNSVFIGWRTSPLASSQTNQIVIGYDATGIGSNTVVLGNDSVVTTSLKGNVGIGTTSPSTNLHVFGNFSSVNPSVKVTHDLGFTNQYIEIIGSAFDEGGIISVGSTSSMIFKRGSNESMRINGSGNVGIGTTAPTAKLDVNGSIKYNGDISPTTAGRASILNETPTSNNPNIVPNNSFLSTGLGGDSGNLALIMYGNPAVYVNSSSNVGIGSTTIQGRFHVYQPTSLGGTAGNSLILQTLQNTGGPSGNAVYIKDYAYRDATGTDWLTWRSHNSIDIDGVYNTPGTNTRTFWERDPLSELHIFGSANRNVLNIDASSNQRVGINVTAPSYPLHVSGNVSNISIYATNDIVAFSDQSVKTNIRPIENALERVVQSRGVLYDRTDSDNKDNIGFIAQELEVAFPELVVTNEDGTKAVKYQNTVAVLFEAIKEQQKQIEELKQIVNGFTN